MEGSQQAALSGMAPAAPDAAPVPQPAPRAYHQLMRAPRHAWWRSLLAILLTGLFAALSLVIVRYVLKLTAPAGTLDRALSDENLSVEGFAILNLLLAMIIPAAMLATRFGHRAPAGFISSVVGRLRWKWMFRCAAIALPPMLLAVTASFLLDWPQEPRPERWLLFVPLVLFSTPLQAAGEEYLVRGVLFQGIGALFRNAAVGLVAAALLSSALFAAMHGSADPWIFIDLTITALACCVLVWQTGGLEAAIALHAANNMVGMLASLTVGGWNEMFVRSESTGSPLNPLLTLIADSAIVWLILKQARRLGIRRTGWLPTRASPTREQIVL